MAAAALVLLQPGDLAKIVDVLLEGLQVVGADWRYLHVSEAAARQGRASRQSLLGRTMMECYPGIENTELFRLIGLCLEKRTPHVFENVFAFPDGTSGCFELRIEPVPMGVCILSIDISARKEAERGRRDAEERQRHGQRMEAIGRLAAGVAHDFNNLLTVILAQAEAAIDSPSGPTRADLETILKAARSSAALTRQLLAYARRSVLAPEVLDLAELVRGFEQVLRGCLESRIELRLEAPAGLGWVEADPTQLEQILLNLVVNARDAIADTGLISVVLEATDLDAESARAHPGTLEGPHLVLSVSDTGAGMDAATQARMFEPFFTTKERGVGTGLGLATVYGIVKQHHGDIWVNSEPGKGTTVKVHLPSLPREKAAGA